MQADAGQGMTGVESASMRLFESILLSLVNRCEDVRVIVGLVALKIFSHPKKSPSMVLPGFFSPSQGRRQVASSQAITPSFNIKLHDDYIYSSSVLLLPFTDTLSAHLRFIFAAN